MPRIFNIHRAHINSAMFMEGRKSEGSITYWWILVVSDVLVLFSSRTLSVGDRKDIRPVLETCWNFLSRDTQLDLMWNNSSKDCRFNSVILWSLLSLNSDYFCSETNYRKPKVQNYRKIPHGCTHHSSICCTKPCVRGRTMSTWHNTSRLTIDIILCSVVGDIAEPTGWWTR